MNFVLTPHKHLTSWKNPTCALKGCTEKPNGGLEINIDTANYIERRKISPQRGLGWMTIVYPLCDKDVKTAEQYLIQLGFCYGSEKTETMRMVPLKEMQGWAQAEEGNVAQMKR